MNPKVRARWAGINKGVHRRDELDGLEAKYGAQQILWAMEQYAKTTPYPNLEDLTEWMAQGVPENLVCAAYLTGEPAIVEMANNLETLAGGWFPGPDDRQEMEQLRERLGKVLL